jgi:hypothetical protein
MFSVHRFYSFFYDMLIKLWKQVCTCCSCFQEKSKFFAIVDVAMPLRTIIQILFFIEQFI